jgi:hypothetical protein
MAKRELEEKKKEVVSNNQKAKPAPP